MIEFLGLLILISWISAFCWGIVELAKSPTHPSNYRQLTSAELCEQQVADTLTTSLDPTRYMIFRNLVLKSQKGSPYTEIDTIVYSPYGITCIEVKSHRGDIYGYTNAGQWKQYIGPECHSFDNPYRQNYKHTQAIRFALGLEQNIPVKSIVVFPYARRVVVDGIEQSYDIAAALSEIQKLSTLIFSNRQCTMHVQTLRNLDSIKIPNLELHKTSLVAHLHDQRSICTNQNESGSTYLQI